VAKYSIAECKFDAERFPTELLWKNNSKSIYTYAKAQLWIEFCLFEHKKISNEEACIEEARKWNTEHDWAKLGRFHSYARLQPFFYKCIEHMRRYKTWTTEKCLDDAKQHMTISDWHKSTGGGYNASKKLGCRAQCFELIKQNQIESGYKKHQRKKELDKPATEERGIELVNLSNYQVSNLVSSVKPLF